MSALRLLLASACVLLSSQLVSSKVGLSDEWDAAYAKVRLKNNGAGAMIDTPVCRRMQQSRS